MIQHFQDANNLIHNSHSILLTMHERMDGDDGGSALAMAHQLLAMGKQASVVIKKGVPAQLAFLPGSEMVQSDIQTGEFDLLITFGCADIARTGLDYIMSLDIPTINIDHHPDNIMFGDVNIVDKTKSSVAELVYDLFVYCNWNITKDIATCLLTGIITDTGSFMHSNTQTSTLLAAAELMKKGTLTGNIIKHTSKNKDPRTLKAWGKAMENMYFDAEQKAIYSVMTKADLEEVGNISPSAFEGFVETLNTIPEARFALFLKQDGDTIKGSLRSDLFKNVDVAKIANVFGGGGHTLAAGFSVMGTLVRDETSGWKVV